MQTAVIKAYNLFFKLKLLIPDTHVQLYMYMLHNDPNYCGLTI